MEELKKRIGVLRAKFNKQGLDVDKLLFILKRDQLLPADHVEKIEKQTTSSAKLNKLLDEIVNANESIYHKLMIAVEQCVPFVTAPSASTRISPVPPAFLNQTRKNQSQRTDAPGPESCSTSLTSDSEDDVLRSCAPGSGDVHRKELAGGYGKLTNILNTHSYDSASSSFLVLNERYSPLTLSDDRPAGRHSPIETVRKPFRSDNSFDWVNFKMQCDGALGELETLKQQNAEKMEQISQKAECFRSLYKKSETAHQQAQKELHTVKTLNVELLATKQQLQETVEQLKKLREDDQLEMDELRLQLNKAISTLSGPGSDTPDTLTDMYHASLQKYDALHKDYDIIRERYADLAAEHSSACCQLEAMDDLRKQMEEMRRERDTTMRDKMAFQQQCTSVIQNLDQTINENRRLKAEYTDLQREHEDCGKNQRQMMARLSQLQKECNMALAAKIDAETEHQQILKERGVVHQELQELNDQVSEKSKVAEKHNREKIAAEKEVDRLKQELASAILARDKFRQESQNTHELCAQLEGKVREAQRGVHLIERQRDAARKERHQALEDMDMLIKKTYEKSQKEKAQEMDQVAKEAEVLKKQIDKIKHELTDAEQEATKATERRDWAFSEINKTVQERESIRILCDNLRRDRDRAVSELAKALRNSDECEKQKNDAVKELKEIRDKYEAMVERDARRQQLNSVGHNHSRDSAIDADLQEWETETLEIELDGGDDHDLGFDLVGGKDSPQFPGDSALYISHVAKGGAAEGKLRVNDLLLKVNNLDTTNSERHYAQQALSNHSKAVILVVRRRKMSSTRIWQPLQLLISCQKEGSIQLEQGLFVSAVHSGRIIGKDGLLPSFGDQIISINHQSTENLTVQEALDLLEKSSQPVSVGILRQSSPLSSTGSSPTPTSVSVLSPLNEQLSPAQSAVMSKSDTLAAHNSMWDSTSGDSARSGGDSSKNLRSSGSQTDSLDSPGPSPPKSLRNHDDKVRHSMPVLDKAKEIVVETLFRSRHKSQDRERNAQKQYSKDEGGEHRSSKDKDRRRGDSSEERKRPVSVMVPNVALISPKGADDVLVEFPSPVFSRTSPNTDSKSRKREYEADSNNGTWPKSRSGLVISSNVPSTVTLTSAKERPSIQDPLIFQPPPQQCKNSGEGGGGFPLEPSSVCHSPQNSTSSSVKYPASTGVIQPFIPSPKSPPHFSVGVMPSAVRPTFPRQWPGQTPPSHHQHSHHPRRSQANPVHSYPHPHPRQQPPHVKSGLTSPLPLHSCPKPVHPDLYPATLHPQRVTPKVGGRSHRPTSAPHRGHSTDRQWPPSPSWAQPLGSPHHSRHYSPKSHSPEVAAAAHRPTSLEVPSSSPSMFKFVEGARVASPVEASVASGLPGWVSESSSHPQSSVSSSSSQHSSRPLMMNPRHSSPPGMFTAINPELEVEHTLFPPANTTLSSPHHHSSPSPSQQSFSGLERITPTPSEDLNPRFIRPLSHGPHNHPLSDVELRHPAGGGYPRHDKHPERIRIPSSNSVTTKSGSVEIVSDRSSPVSSILPFDRSGSSKEQRHSLTSSRDDYLFGPRHHETRTITFQSPEPVGFQIQGGPAGGIFVSAVSENSLASKAGLVIGDQLLEVFGINMRNATREHAVAVLRQCRENIRMKVQFNPEKYMDGKDSPDTVSSMSSVTLSPAHSKLNSGDSEQSTPKHHPPQRSKSCGSGDGGTYERFHVVPIKCHKGEGGPGFSIVGGNAVGIFIHDIDPSSPTASVLQKGYKILEYNNVSFQALTLEQAFLELNKPCSTMRLNIVSCVSKYNKVQNIPGDHFFIRTNFARTAEGEGELDFEKDDILMVENTMHRGTLGLWHAWLLDQHGIKQRCGSIPSRLRLGDEMVLKRSHSESWSLGEADDLKGSRRGSGSVRRSIFRRRRHHRNNSKDSREGSFSEVSLNSESVPILDESVLGYTQVERIESNQTRPVVLLAPLADSIIRKLVSESPDKYKLCEPCTVRALMKDMEQSVAEGRLVDYWKKDDLFECIQVSNIRSISDEKIHCLLDVNSRAIERLHRLKIYPIVIFVRHKSAKQLREIRDSQFLPERLTSKASKDSYDHFVKLEEDYSHLFSTVVQGGNLAEMSTHVKVAINAEQKKAIWVSVSCL